MVLRLIKPWTFFGSVFVYLMSHIDAMNNGWASLLVGVALLISLAWILWRQARGEWVRVWLGLSAFTANVDLMLALGIAGYVNSADFYLKGAEPYFMTGHGFAVNLWDATAHWFCCVYALSGPKVLTTRSVFFQLFFNFFFFQHVSPLVSFPRVCAFFFGSVLHSVPVIILAALYERHLTPAALLNVPFFVVPFVFLARLCFSPRITDTTSNTGHPNPSSSSSSPPLRRSPHFFLPLVLFLSCAHSAFRAFGPHVMMMTTPSYSQYPFSCISFSLLSLSSLLLFVHSSLQPSLLVLSPLLHASLGAHCQAIFAHTIQRLWQPSSSPLQPPPLSVPPLVWWSSNALTIILPIIAIALNRPETKKKIN